MATKTTSTTHVTYSNGTTSTLSFAWAVDSVKVKNENGNSNAVIQTYWTLAATDNANNTGTFKGATPFTTVGMSGDFKAFESLTEADVITWIQGQVVGNYEDHILEQIVKQLDAQVVEVSEPNLPWAPPKEDMVPPPNPNSPIAQGGA